MREKRVYCLFLFLSLFLFFIIPASAQKIGHITLLAVSETTQVGSTADLYLRIQQGSGGIYIDTFPLTKLDTQLSTRFAQQIACDFLDQECDTIDFFYTIRSDATIIGGPSAGAALATLTVAMLDDLPINESVSISGTINVGGLIGPVGSLLGKIDAAKEKGIAKVLIPKGSRYEEKPVHSYNALLEDNNASFYISNNETNSTEIDLYEYGKMIGIEVKEVGTLQEAVYEVTDLWYEANEKEIVPEQWYTKTMGEIAKELCQRNRDLLDEIKETEENETDRQSIFEEVNNMTLQAENASAYGMQYVAASTCFGTNIRLNYYLLGKENLTLNKTINKTLEINQTIAEIEKEGKKEELETITDLQTYLVVNERLEEAKETLKEMYINIGINLLTESEYNLAYATERLYSARAWAKFFENNDKELVLETAALEDSCIQKLAEAQERYQYVRLITQEPMQNVVNYLDRANEEWKKDNYVLCLDIASRAKANLDIILSLIGVKEEAQLKELVEERLKLVRQVLNKQQEKGYFPMLGYSYYEYAQFLKEKDPYSALIYSHYALEFSHLDMYFKEKKKKILLPDGENTLYLFLGFGTGIVFCGLIFLGRRMMREKSLQKKEERKIIKKKK